MDADTSDDSRPPLVLLETSPRAPLEELSRLTSKTENKEVRIELCSPTTAPHTPGIWTTVDATWRGLRLINEHQRGAPPRSAQRPPSTPKKMLPIDGQQKALISELGRSCVSEGGLRCFKYPNTGPSHLKSRSQASEHARCSASIAFDSADASFSISQPKVPKVPCGRRKALISLWKRKDCCRELHAVHSGGVDLNTGKAKEKAATTNRSTCTSTENTSFQQLLKQYRQRRLIFEKNCSQRYQLPAGVALHNRRIDILWKPTTGGFDDKSQWCRPSPPRGRSRKGDEGNQAGLTTFASCEKSMNQRIGESEEASAACRERDTPLSEGGLLRHPKGFGQKCFPYKQFHVHHYLPEPESKAGLLTHPTPAQFNKYPRARGVWFDPHRNLVRTCWKENGKAKTMGFPVNKFGLEEARILAVEYHYYKCPTDPLPDDLSTLIPRKPPHAYGWC